MSELVATIGLEVHLLGGRPGGVATNPATTILEDLGGAALAAGGGPGLGIDVGEFVAMNVDRGGLAGVGEGASPVLNTGGATAFHDGGGAATITNTGATVEGEFGEVVSIATGGLVLDLADKFPFLFGVATGVELSVGVSTSPILNIVVLAYLGDAGLSAVIANAGAGLWRDGCEGVGVSGGGLVGHSAKMDINV